MLLEYYAEIYISCFSVVLRKHQTLGYQQFYTQANVYTLLLRTLLFWKHNSTASNGMQVLKYEQFQLDHNPKYTWL
jgi:hypothetical protein